MGVLGAYWALQCGSHWFTYSVISFLPYAVTVVIVVYFALVWLLSQYNFGQVKDWLLAGAISAPFSLGCFVFEHLQPPIQLYNGTDCQPL